MSDLLHSWGKSWQLPMPHWDLVASVYYFTGVKGGASSLHMHERKANLFVVTHGILCVTVQGKDHLLISGQSIVVQPGEPHRMRFVTDASGYELYYPTANQRVSQDDIVRLEPGITPDGKVYQQWQA